MKLALVKLKFFSPYTSVPWFLEHGRGSPVPPPSTLIGALSAVYFYPEERDIPDEFVSKVKYATFWVPPYTVAENLSRHFSAYSQRKQRLKALRAALEVARGRHVDDAVLKDLMNYGGVQETQKKLFKEGKITELELSRTVTQMLFQPATRLEVYYWGDAYALYALEEGLEELVGGIFRIGPKETLVSAWSVRIEKVEKIRDLIKTRFYVPCRAFKEGCEACRGQGTIGFMALKPQADPLQTEPEPFCIPDSAPFESSFLSFSVSDLAEGWSALRLQAPIGQPLDVVVPNAVAESIS